MPALCRASTLCRNKQRKTWMAGTKPGHDERKERLERRLSVAPHDGDALLSAAASGHDNGLRGATRHIGPVGRYDIRRISMRPIPGNIIRIGVTDIAGRWLRSIDDGLASRWVVEEAACSRPERPYIVSPVMPERLGEWRTGHRMRRSKPCAGSCSGPRECLVRGKHKRYCAEGRDQRPIHFIRHGTHQFVGYWQPSKPS